MKYNKVKLVLTVFDSNYFYQVSIISHVTSRNTGKYFSRFSHIAVFASNKHLVYLTLAPHIVNKPWISRKNEKTVKIMIKT